MRTFMIEKVLIEGIEFPLNPETDAFIDGHVYCKECGEQLDLEPINLQETFIYSVRSAYAIEKKKKCLRKERSYSI